MPSQSEKAFFDFIYVRDFCYHDYLHDNYDFDNHSYGCDYYDCCKNIFLAELHIHVLAVLDKYGIRTMVVNNNGHDNHNRHKNNSKD